MELQQKILRKLIELYGRQTLKTMSIITGLSIAKLHRIFSGQEMKISDYEKILKAVNARRTQTSSLDSIFHDAKKHLSEGDALFVKSTIERRMKYSF